jgi:hypothetical protein
MTAENDKSMSQKNGPASLIRVDLARIEVVALPLSWPSLTN